MKKNDWLGWIGWFYFCLKMNRMKEKRDFTEIERKLERMKMNEFWSSSQIFGMKHPLTFILFSLAKWKKK